MMICILQIQVKVTIKFKNTIKRSRKACVILRTFLMCSITGFNKSYIIREMLKL